MTALRAGILILIVLAGAAVVLYILRRARRGRPVPMDEMEGHDFEYYCADLLADNGFSDVQVTRGSGDFGVDILARQGDVTYAVQCKCYDGPVGVAAVQEVYAGRDFYDCMVGVVMTNQYFTNPAKQLAGKLKIILWDRDVLETLVGEE